MSADPLAGWRRVFAELKRRQVFRVVAVYGATAFVVMQAADLILPRLALPDWTVTLIVVVALLGLPVAAGLAWAFESGAGGMRRTQPAAHEELAAIAAQPRTRHWPAAVAGLIGVALLAAGAWVIVGRDDRPSYDSIAVLPFNNLSGQPENDYFGDGLAEELINALAGIEGLRVAARTSAFAFKGTNTDIRVIGDTLNVATVLEGSVRRSEGRIRITAQLVDAHSGYHIWSHNYDRPIAELFSVQDAIASEIVAALVPRLSRSETHELYRGGTKDVEAYDLYLLGRKKWAEREVPLLRESVTHFEAAIARDSSFALAWSGLGDALDALLYRSVPDQGRIPEAKSAALRAILLEPEMAEGWASLGVLVLDFDRDWKVGELALRRAIELRPGYAFAHRGMSDLLGLTGRIDEALVHARQAAQLDPLAGFTLMAQAHSLHVLGRFAEARAAFLRAVSASSIAGLGMAIHARDLGFSAEEAAHYAREWARRFEVSNLEDVALVGRAVLVPGLRMDARAAIRRLEREGKMSMRDLATASAAIGDYTHTIDLLERLVELRQPPPGVAANPVFDPLRADPRFIRILSALRLPNCDAPCRAAAAARAPK